jgi:hypothetical protein
MAKPNRRPTEHEESKPLDNEVRALMCITPDTRWKDELTRELLEQLVIAARIGGFRKQTAIACNVRPELLEYWLSEGMRPDAPILMQELSARFQGTQAQQNLMLTGIVSSAALRGDWQAAVTLLSKRDPQWSGKTDGDNELSRPELSAAERHALLVVELRKSITNRESSLALALEEAGLLPERSSASELLDGQQDTSDNSTGSTD